MTDTVTYLAEISGNINVVGYGIAALGPGIGVGLVFAAYIQATARQPETAGLTRVYMFMGFAVVERSRCSAWFSRSHSRAERTRRRPQGRLGDRRERRITGQMGVL